MVEDSYERLGDRPTVGPELHAGVRRAVRARTAAGRRTGRRAWSQRLLPEILFVCVRNAGPQPDGRGADARAVQTAQVAVRSAGSHPTERIDPVVVEAMREVGIDVRMEFPKPLTDEVVRAADVVVTLGCGDACPIYPGKRYEDWDVADPAGQPLEVVRRIRYDIHHHVAELLESLEHAMVAVT